MIVLTFIFFFGTAFILINLHEHVHEMNFKAHGCKSKTTWFDDSIAKTIAYDCPENTDIKEMNYITVIMEIKYTDILSDIIKITILFFILLIVAFRD